jgi:hypothetical protein
MSYYLNLIHYKALRDKVIYCGGISSIPMERPKLLAQFPLRLMCALIILVSVDQKILIFRDLRKGDKTSSAKSLINRQRPMVEPCHLT